MKEENVGRKEEKLLGWKKRKIGIEERQEERKERNGGSEREKKEIKKGMKDRKEGGEGKKRKERKIKRMDGQTDRRAVRQTNGREDELKGERMDGQTKRRKNIGRNRLEILRHKIPLEGSHFCLKSNPTNAIDPHGLQIGKDHQTCLICSIQSAPRRTCSQILKIFLLKFW